MRGRFYNAIFHRGAMKKSFRFTPMFLVIALFVLEAASTGLAATRNRKLAVVKGKPPVEFVGTIKQIITNSLPYQITVDGSSNSDSKDAPKGSVTFDVQASCHIKAGGGKSGSFGDLKVDQRVGLSYALEAGKHFQATTIDLDAPAAPAKADVPKKKK